MSGKEKYKTTHNKIKPMNTQENEAIAKLVALLSQSIDIMRNLDLEDDADYIEREMNQAIETYKKTHKKTNEQ